MVPVKLVPFDHCDLRLGEPLPVPLHDAAGRLLVAAGVVLRDGERLAALARHGLFTELRHALEWKRRVNAAADAKLRQNALLKDVAVARPDVPARARGHDERAPMQAWQDGIDQLDALLREATRAPGPDWAERLSALRCQMQALLERWPDASLYLLIHEAGHDCARHSAHHAALAMAVCELAAPLLDWPAEASQRLAVAAMTMNVSVWRLADQWAASERPPATAAQPAELAAHARAGAALLESLALRDAQSLEIVARHHEALPADAAAAGPATVPRMTALLQRADVLAGRICRRAVGEPAAPALAVREACLGPDGQPDAIGSALLRATGLFPPGSFVELAGGEIGIVVARGRRANLPHVAALVGASGAPLGVPALRDTVERRYAVKTAIPAARVRVRPPHERLIAMR